MLGIAISEAGQIYVAGANQMSGMSEMVLFTCNLTNQDCYDSTQWTSIMPDFVTSDEYWVDGRGSANAQAVSAYGDVAVVVGNYKASTKGGWAIMTRDSGQTWEDLTDDLKALLPDEDRVPKLYDVHVHADGSVLIVGEQLFKYSL